MILVFNGEIMWFCADMLIYTCDVGIPLGGVDKGEIAHTLARHITTVAAMLDVSWTEAFAFQGMFNYKKSPFVLLLVL